MHWLNLIVIQIWSKSIDSQIAAKRHNLRTGWVCTHTTSRRVFGSSHTNVELTRGADLNAWWRAPGSDRTDSIASHSVTQSDRHNSFNSIVARSDIIQEAHAGVQHNNYTVSVLRGSIIIFIFKLKINILKCASFI